MYVFIHFLSIDLCLKEDQDGGQSVGQRKRVKLSSTTKGNDGSITHKHLWYYVKRCRDLLSSCSLSLPLDPSIMDSLKHKCFLEELLFWTIKYEFPQRMVTFLLNMLPDQDYKVFS